MAVTNTKNRQNCPVWSRGTVDRVLHRTPQRQSDDTRKVVRAAEN